MRKLRIILICICLLSVLCLPRTVFAAFEGGIYKVFYGCWDTAGKMRWHATAEIRNKESDVYVIMEKMEGRYYGFEGPISWLAWSEFERTDNTIKPIGMDQRIFDKSGKPIAVRREKFDFTGKIITCVYDDLIKGTSVTKKFRFNKEVTNRLLEGIYIQKFLENGERSRNVQFISSEPALYDFELRIVAEEEIEINGQKRKAYKICFDPQLGALSFVKVFLPKIFVWHSAEPPFELLKYKGVETGINSPAVEIIMTSESGSFGKKEPKKGL